MSHFVEALHALSNEKWSFVFDIIDNIRTVLVLQNEPKILKVLLNDDKCVKLFEQPILKPRNYQIEEIELMMIKCTIEHAAMIYDVTKYVKLLFFAAINNRWDIVNHLFNTGRYYDDMFYPFCMSNTLIKYTFSKNQYENCIREIIKIGFVIPQFLVNSIYDNKRFELCFDMM